MKYIKIILFLLLPSFVLHAQTSLDTAVNFTVQDVNGATHSLHQYLSEDKIVVIDFFTTTCGSCSVYAPLINESFTHFGCNTSNVVFLGVNWGSDNNEVIEFGNSVGMHFPEISGTEGNGNHVVADFGVLSYPSIILIKPDWAIAEKYIWPPNTEHLDSTLIAHGGITAGCATSLSEVQYNIRDVNKILSVYPVPSKTSVTCSTSVISESYIEIVTVSGKSAIDCIPVVPGVDTHIETTQLTPGFYIILLRNKQGSILDRMPLLIQNH